MGSSWGFDRMRRLTRVQVSFRSSRDQDRVRRAVTQRRKHQMSLPAPENAFVTPLLTDFYQISMCYAYFKAKMHEQPAVFELFFRKNPFKGAFTVLAGTDEVLRFVSNFKFTAEHIAYLRTVMPHAEDAFFDYLAELDCSKVKISTIAEGTVVFPKEPLIRVEGPLAVAQLLETPLLNLINYPSLIATNAARMRLAAGPTVKLLEFGLRRAQGPDGGMSGSKYAMVGGFDATSNVLAGMMFDIPIQGTHAHSFITSFTSLDDVDDGLTHGPVVIPDFKQQCVAMRERLGYRTNDSELAAFISYAISFPATFLALVDTYSTLDSGVKNYVAVAAVLASHGIKPLGIRLDSGDLAYLSIQARKQFREADEKLGLDLKLENSTIVASNDINESILHSLKEQKHDIDTFGIGTHLVTCQAQPALGCVYKLVQVRGMPRIKLSNEKDKMTIPGLKQLYRIHGRTGPILDLLTRADDPAPAVGESIMAMHPFQEEKRARVTPVKVEKLLLVRWDGRLVDGYTLPSVSDTREFVKQQLRVMREDHIRSQFPTPYKLSVTQTLFASIRKLWLESSPVAELC
ncbi:Nicotinate phosphoribosyltransferase family [Carpediemonas membranifera]|uniref:Nicotinate phosphoribosyltransferase n=1 Tax=Carpediemonas membranifera TaxID=201153 RepID=A0A8J6DXM2_9EUKA|nr:Nicotinate phosphoribosyltransferase family [Carpediemonas membranifera]|eukprot:KAG9390459.1 Nicotinate phosphoribosyltransferase family [Carpediemonas membranifera]